MASGVSKVSTGIGFFDHMLDLLARHSRIDITVKADGDLHVDHHHTTEDVGIALGQAVKQALGTMAGITRYASIHMPMDETLSRVVIDISGRPVLVFKVDFPRDKVGHLRHRAGARMVQRVHDQRRRDFARRDPIWREQPSYRRILLQGSGQGASRSRRDRSARRGRSAVHQGSARRLISEHDPDPEGRFGAKWVPVFRKDHAQMKCPTAESYDAGLYSSCPGRQQWRISRRPTSSPLCATASISGPGLRERDLACLASAVAGADRLDLADQLPSMLASQSLGSAAARS